MRRGLLTVVSLLAAAAITPPARAADPYTVDIVLSLTGPGALLGQTEQRALQQFETVYAKDKPIGDRPLHFAFHDDQSSPQVAVQLATQIIGRKPAVMLGSTLVASCNAITPLVRRGPVDYCFSPGIHPAAGSFVFSGSVSTTDLGAAQLRYFRLKGLTKLALITSTDASGTDAARNIHELLARPENKDLQLVGEQTFNPTDISASAQVERLKGAQPQALIAWSTGAAIGTVFKAVHDAGLDIPVATTDGNMTYATMDRFAAILPNELYIPSPEWPLTDKIQDEPDVAAAKHAFYDAFKGTDIKPDNAAALAWDPALLVFTALRKLGPSATPDQVRSYFETLKGFAGLKGTYDFPAVPQRGLSVDNVVITRWDPKAQIWDVISKKGGTPF